MNKAYFFVKPSSFVRLGDINIDGEFEYVNCKDFDYCQSCYQEKKYIHDHPFYKLRFIIQ